MAAHRPVLVGFDGSTSSRLAAYWAAQEAAGAHRPLRLACTLRWPLPELDRLGLPPGTVDAGRVRQAAAATLEHAVQRCRDLAPGVDVRGELLTGGTVELLTRLASDAELLVLGASGQSGITRVLLGSSAAELARRVTTSVVVVRDVPDVPATGAGGTAARGRVVIGVDGSPGTGRVAELGFDVAARRGRELVAVHAWCDLPLDALSPAGAVDRERARAESAELLERLLAPARERRPDVPVRHVVSVDRPAQALLGEAAGAALLVVGRHGRAHDPEAPLGSVSHAVLHYARCPVAIAATG